MGTAYLAEQHEPTRGHVALKVVKLGMDTSQVLARFANERQGRAMISCVDDELVAMCVSLKRMTSNLMTAD